LVNCVNVWLLQPMILLKMFYVKSQKLDHYGYLSLCVICISISTLSTRPMFYFLCELHGVCGTSNE